MSSYFFLRMLSLSFGRRSWWRCVVSLSPKRWREHSRRYRNLDFLHNGQCCKCLLSGKPTWIHCHSFQSAAENIFIRIAYSFSSKKIKKKWQEILIFSCVSDPWLQCLWAPNGKWWRILILDIGWRSCLVGFKFLLSLPQETESRQILVKR